MLRWFGAPVWLSGWSDDELDRAARTVPSEVLAPARRYGLSDYVGGARWPFSSSRSGGRPTGWVRTRLDGAAAAYQLAIDSGHESAKQMAAIQLRLLRESGGATPTEP